MFALLYGKVAKLEKLIFSNKRKLKVVADEAAALANLNNGEWGMYEITGTGLVIYGKEVDGTAYKVALTAV